MKDVHHNASAFSCEPRTQSWLRLEVSALSNSNVQASELPTDVPILADNPPLDALCIVLLQLPATNIPDSCIFTRPALGFVWLILFTRAVANRDQDRSLASVSGVWLLTRSCACPAQLPPQPKLTGDRLFLHSVRQGDDIIHKGAQRPCVWETGNARLAFLAPEDGTLPAPQQNL